MDSVSASRCHYYNILFILASMGWIYGEWGRPPVYLLEIRMNIFQAKRNPCLPEILSRTREFRSPLRTQNLYERISGSLNRAAPSPTLKPLIEVLDPWGGFRTSHLSKVTLSYQNHHCLLPLITVEGHLFKNICHRKVSVRIKVFISREKQTVLLKFNWCYMIMQSMF